MFEMLKNIFAATLISLIALAAGCKAEGEKALERGSLKIATSPELAGIVQELARNFSGKFMISVDVKTVETSRLMSLEDDCDFLIGVERDKAIQALTEKASGRSAALWISDDIVLAVRKGEIFEVRKARDMQQPIIHPVALPSQREEIGRMALELFDYWKLREVMKPRIRITPDSASALKMLKNGEVRAAVAPSHLVAADPSIKQAFSFSPLAHQSIRKVALRCPRARRLAAADEFERMLGKEGISALLQAGYKAFDKDF